MEQIIIFLLICIALELTYIAIKINKKNEEKIETKMDNIPFKNFKETEDDLKIIDKELEILTKKIDNLSKKIDFFSKKEMINFLKLEEWL